MNAVVLVDSLRFPESPRWHQGKLWFTDLYGRRVIQVYLHGAVLVVVELPNTPTTLGWTPYGRMLVDSATARRLLRLEDGGLVSAPILFVTPDGGAQMLADGLAFPKGMAPMPDGQTLIVDERHGTRLAAVNLLTFEI